jgi:hypothetical protein
MGRLPAILAAAALSVGAAACNRTSEPDRSPSPVSSAEPAGGSPGGGGTAKPARKSRPSGPADVAWDPPARWIKAEQPGPMRKATYRVPHAVYAPTDPEDGDLSVSQAGGTVEQNVARWALQLDRKLPDVKRTERNVNGLKVTVVEIHGDYSGMAAATTAGGAPPAAKKPRWELLGAIVETSPPTFFKLTGPEQTVTAAQHDFDQMVDGVRAK